MNVSAQPITTSRLGGYLLGGLGAVTTVATQQADAAVNAFVFTPTVINGTTGYNTNNSGGFGSVITYGIYNEGTSTISLGSLGSGSSVYNSGTYFPGPYSYGLTSFFAPGTVIGAGGNGTLSTGFFSDFGPPGVTYTTDQQGYIAFKTSTNYYGFAEVTWIAATKTLTINSACVADTPNTSITIVPEPSVAGLLALGAIAAARTRRRVKNAA